MLPLRIININNAQHIEMATRFGYEVINVCRPTVLGNPYTITDENERDSAIEMYRRWIWDKIKRRGHVYNELRRIERAWREGGRVALACHCAPRKCHADIVARAIIWLVNNTPRTASNAEIDNLRYRFERFDWSYEMSDDGSVWRRGSNEQAELIREVKKLTTAEFLMVRKGLRIPKANADEPNFYGWARTLLLLDIETPDNLLTL